MYMDICIWIYFSLSKVKTEAGRKQYIETNLNPWLELDKTGRASFELTPITEEVAKVSQAGFHMKMICGIFWPKAIYESHFEEPHRVNGYACIMLSAYLAPQ